MALMKAPGKLRTWSIPNKIDITPQTTISAPRRRKGEIALCLKHSAYFNCATKLCIFHEKLAVSKTIVRLPCHLHVFSMITIVEERCLEVLFERRPITADDSIVCYNWLENATIVMGMMPVLGRKNYITALIADEIFVVWGNQEELATTESPCATIFCQIELPAFPPLHTYAVAQECDASSAVADIQS